LLQHEIAEQSHSQSHAWSIIIVVAAFDYMRLYLTYVSRGHMTQYENTQGAVTVC